MILQRAGDDFRSRRRAAINQDDHRLALGQVARTRVVAHRFIGIPAPGRNDFAAVEEAVDDGDRLVEQTAGIVAQVKYIALELGGRDIALEFLDRRANTLKRLFVELGDSNVADIVAFLTFANRFDLDHGAGNLDILRVLVGSA